MSVHREPVRPWIGCGLRSSILLGFVLISLVSGRGRFQARSLFGFTEEKE
jgi:hypothetical protein